jgi:hypothetical protein
MSPNGAAVANRTRLHDDVVGAELSGPPRSSREGGSEDQILAGNWLLEHRNGQWFTLHLYWNNPSGAADPKEFLPVLTKLLALAESTMK